MTINLEKPNMYKQEPIAVVGIGAIFPDAKNKDEFWQNIVTGKNSIKEVPKYRWDPALFYDPDSTIPDKTYTKIGAFIEGFQFNPTDFRILPKVLEQIDPVQQMALYAAKEALEDANYERDDFPRERCAVIIGNSLGGEKSSQIDLRVLFPYAVESIKSTDQFKSLSDSDKKKFLNEIEKKYKKNIPEITEDSMPGELANIIAGRIAAVFNLRGKNMTSDAACASSLAAIDVAYKGLQMHEFDAAVVGGSDRTMDPPTYVKFSKIGALSPDGSRPFDADANGFVMGEGSGMIIVKRLSDAQKANDKIYALIIGIGSSSDGKGKGITAPNPIGQELAIRRAYETAKITPKEIQLIEAHGTSTKVGDKVEVSVLNEIFKEAKVRPKSVKLGSIKSQIGHLKSAAGAAGIIKAVLALHYRLFPPSINFKTPNPNIDWNNCPLEVNTKPNDWNVNDSQIRRAGVSSFGFGGTNFHVVLEEYNPNRNYYPPDTSIVETSSNINSWSSYVLRNKELEPESLILSNESLPNLLSDLSELSHTLPSATCMTNENEDHILETLGLLHFSNKEKYRVGMSISSLEEIKKLSDLAIGSFNDPKQRGVARARGVFVSEGIKSGKIAFLFPGQGSQYADMLLDLSKKYQVVKETFEEADQILNNFMTKPLSTYIFSNGKDKAQVEEHLRQTQITQPAMLTADVAIYRLLLQFGIKPEMVAGHSLGEYCALIASEVISFEDALKAVAIRGKAMSEVDAKDKGTMASISGPIDKVEKILKEIDEYVIAANKNSLTTTVISGSTKGIETAIKVFEKKGFKAIKLSVSAAFHTKIVEPAAEPLSEFLDSINFSKPKIPITSNVTGDFFPDNPEKIRDLMKKQVGAPVEWTKQVQNMNKKGATIFFEVGPKRALSSFVSDILGENVLSVNCNHPKRGGIKSFNDAIAAAAAFGISIYRVKAEDNILHHDYRWKKMKILESNILKHDVSPKSIETKAYSKDDFSKFMSKTLEYMDEELGSVHKLGLNLDNIVVSGVGIGLPGKHKEIFSEDNFTRVLSGENLIDNLPNNYLDSQLNKNIRRLIKKPDGSAEFYYPKTYKDVINLAGVGGKFDLVEEFHVNKELAETYDIATSLAIAAGLEALRDAGIPLVKSYKKTSTGSYLPGDWELPHELQDDTGIIFASAFPGYDNFARELKSYYTKKQITETKNALVNLYGEISRRVSSENEKQFILNKLDQELASLDKQDFDYTFNRKLLLSVLSMGHSQFAQLIKAKGPNTQINAACASTTQAIGVANDWIRDGRCKRVIVISGDNVTSDNLFEWLGSGFLASGAASVKDKVEEAALPFDRRRAGMIIGMGAAALVIETESEVRRRGIQPITEIMGTYYSNSSYHGTRLDVNHVSSELQKFMNFIKRSKGIEPRELAKSMMFMSHETYTPRRGGSASAEIRSLRDSFGDMANNIFIANTKGFTGHAMGAGIEDVVAIKSIERGEIPPIANFKEPDPDLGNLQLSKGGKIPVEYCLRLAAGFGSQVAFVLYKKASYGDRFNSPIYEKWLRQIGGSRKDLYLAGKSLRIKDKGAPGKLAGNGFGTTQIIKKPSEAPKEKKTIRPVIGQTQTNKINKTQVLSRIIDLVSNQTGYPKEMLDPELDMEADLGIDSVKQAELFGMIREEYNIPQIDDLQIADYPTLNHIIDFVMNNSVSSIQRISKPDSVILKSKDQNAKLNKDTLLSHIIDVIANQTGYPTEMLDPELDMEADLGIDSVKQAELFGMIREEYNIPQMDDLQIADYPRITDIVDFVINNSQPSGTKVEISKPKETMVEESPKTTVDSSIKGKIFSVLSDISGYPEMMLEDSLKLKEDLGLNEESKSKFLNKLKGLNELSNIDFNGVKTVSDILDLINGKELAINETEIVRKEKPKQEKPKLAKKETVMNVNNEGRDVVLNKITEIIAEKSGYPLEMLEPDLGLEEDLGIDSVKQAEIFGIARETFNIPIIEDMNIADYDTINKLTDFLLVNLPNNKPSTIETEKVSEKPTEKISSMSSVKREDVFNTFLDLISERTGYPTIMLDPDLGLEEDLGIDSVKTAEIFGIARERYGIPELDDIEIVDYNTINKLTDLVIQKIESGQQEPISQQKPEEVKNKPEILTHRFILKQLNKEMKSTPPKNGIIIGRKNKTITEIIEKSKYVQYPSIKDSIDLKPNSTIIFYNPSTPSIKSVSEVFSFIKNNLEKINRLVLATKFKDPNDIHMMTPFQGAIGGLIKSIGMEFENITPKIIFFEDTNQLVNELSNPDVEVLYKTNKRYIVCLEEENLPISEGKLPKNGVILASGGGQGITYETMKSIITSGNTVILLGRTEIRDDAEVIAGLSEEEKQKRKMNLMNDLKSKYEKVTPVILEKEWSKISKSADVWKNIRSLEEIGANVIYKSVDITDQNQLKSIFSEINKELKDKKINYFIHGAGIEISKPTINKSQEEFDFVYNVKATGLDNLLNLLDLSKIERIIGFSSVAGRFGNATQADYSAANEYMTKKIAELYRDGIHASIISWSAWDEVGMATRGSTMKVLESQGVTAIPLKEGIQLFRNEFFNGKEIEVIISGELGNLISNIHFFEPNYEKGVMLDSINFKTKEGYRNLNLTKDKYLDDHRIDGKAVLPGVMGLESMAELNKALYNDDTVEMNDVVFSSPVKLPKDKDLDIIIQARKIGDNINLELKSKFIGPDGKQLGDLREHFKATILKAEPIPSYPVIEAKELSSVENEEILSKENIYKIFFHGSSYQVLAKLIRFSENSTITSFNKPKKLMFEKKEKLEIRPLLIEAGFQGAGLHLLMNMKIMGLPSAVKKIIWFNNKNNPAYIIAHYKNSTDTHSIYDVEIVDKEGNCVIKLVDYEMVHTGSVEIDEIKKKNEIEFDKVHHIAGILGVQVVIINIDPLENVSQDFIETFLSLKERSRYNELKITKRRKEWLAGRIAAKISLSIYLTTPITKIEINKDKYKSPYTIINGKRTNVSISHSHGIALAVSGDLAIDVEVIDKREKSFLTRSFSVKEIENFNLNNATDDEITKLWTMKESHLKRMRIGLQTDLREVEIQLTNNLKGKVKSKEGQSEVISRIEGNWIVTLAF